MGELQSAIDSLAAEDLKPMFGPQLLEQLGPLLTERNRLDAEIVRRIRECELTGASESDGLKTMQAWLRGPAHLAPPAAAAMVKAGRALEHLPAVAAGFADGSITAAQVAVIAPIAADDALAAAAEQQVDLAAIDQALAAVTVSEQHDKLAQVVRAYLEALDPDGPEPDPTEGRRLSIPRHADGSRSGRFDLDAVGGEKFEAAIESIVQANRPKGDERTRAQQNADALVQLCDNQLAAGTLPTMRTQKPHVVVTIDAEDLTDTTTTGHGAGETGFGTTLSAARVRWLACDARISRIVMG